MEFQLQFWVACIAALAMASLGLSWAYYLFEGLSDIDLNTDDEQSKLTSDLSRIDSIIHVGKVIQEGAKEFLKQQYKACLYVVIALTLLILFLVDFQTAFSFVVGAGTSMACGALGMLVATFSNYRTTLSASKSLDCGFKTAYKAGSVIGYTLVSTSLIVLVILVSSLNTLKGCSFDHYFQSRRLCFKELFQSLAGFGLGGSTIALFGRVGGGIYTKAADVGADLVGKIQTGLPQDSPKNPATIADNVGDNVGDIAGMGADLFGSLAESTCAALLISADSLLRNQSSIELKDMSFPLILVGLGIMSTIGVNYFGLQHTFIRQNQDVQATLKKQLYLSTILLTPVLYLGASVTYPLQFKMAQFQGLTSWQPFLCACSGLWAGLFIGIATEYVTSSKFQPVIQLANSCKTGAATNIIYGLSLGYISTLVPVLSIAGVIYVSITKLGFYGVALASLGMLSNLPISLAIDCYGPISDNAGGIAEMSQLNAKVRMRTDVLDAAGNTTAAIGKGFAIGSAALVSTSLYGGFLHICQLDLQIDDPQVQGGMLLGAMLPYVFSAMTMKSVGKAALSMVEQVRRQLKNNRGILTGQSQPDYKACIRISTQESLREMIMPGCLVIFTPLVFGFIAGPRVLAGLLPGSLVSGVQMAISSSNSGGAWDNAKKFIQSGQIKIDGISQGKGSDLHKSAVVGDTVGDPLKDTSGPALNILIKLMAIISLVFGQFLKKRMSDNHE